MLPAFGSVSPSLRRAHTPSAFHRHPLAWTSLATLSAGTPSSCAAFFVGVTMRVGRQWPAAARTDGRVLYRCEFDRRFAVPAELADHPPVTLRQDAILAALDADLAEMFSDPRALAAALLAEDRASAEQRSLHERRRRLQDEIDNLVGFIAKGTASDAIAAALAAKETELAQINQRFTEIARPEPVNLVGSVAELIVEFVGVVSSSVGIGRLIHAVSGRASGTGWWRTNRSGCAA
ncbi:hypothetical protein [Georgenia yuyongxinii]